MNGTFLSRWRPGASDLRAIFVEEVRARGGSVVNVYEAQERLFIRATLTGIEGEVRKGDRLRGGVALRTRDRDVLIHPYSYRQVCSNGIIHVQAIGTGRVERIDPGLPAEETVGIVEEVRAAIASACRPEGFLERLGTMQTALEREADEIFLLLPFLLRARDPHVLPFLEMIERRFRSDGDRTLYDLSNAITSVARDTQDPEARWRLEELGGSVPALVLPQSPSGSWLAALEPEAEERLQPVGRR